MAQTKKGTKKTATKKGTTKTTMPKKTGKSSARTKKSATSAAVKKPVKRASSTAAKRGNAKKTTSAKKPVSTKASKSLTRTKKPATSTKKTTPKGKTGVSSGDPKFRRERTPSGRGVKLAKQSDFAGMTSVTITEKQITVNGKKRFANNSANAEATQRAMQKRNLKSVTARF